MTTVIFAVITVLVKATCIKTGTKAALHTDSPDVWGNVSALITHWFWEGRRTKRQTELKSEKVTSDP